MPSVGVVLSVAVMIAICIGCSSKEPVPPTVSMTDSTVTINGTTWTRQNLNIETPDSSWCYDNADSNCAKYGRLYTYDAAKTACQSMGDKWRLPTNKDWDDLMKAAVGGKKVGRKRSGTHVLHMDIGKKLKSKEGWKDNGNGTDDYGFSGLPGGVRIGSSTGSGLVGLTGIWWSATESDGDLAYFLMMYSEFDYASMGHNYKPCGFSVRCVAETL